MGRITGVHGLDGNVKVRSFADRLIFTLRGARLFIRTENSGDARPLVIEKVSYRTKRGCLMQLSGVNNRDLADALIGKEILVISGSSFRNQTTMPGTGRICTA
jgi:16S rRNA processing protein RimM